MTPELRSASWSGPSARSSARRLRTSTFHTTRSCGSPAPRPPVSLDPLIQAAFMYKNLPHAPIDVPNMSWTEVDLCPDSSNPEVAKFDLTLFLARSSAGVSGTISYSADLFDRDRIERLAASFLQILHSCVVDPDQRIHDLTLLTPTDREQLARIANPTPPVTRLRP